MGRGWRPRSWRCRRRSSMTQTRKVVISGKVASGPMNLKSVRSSARSSPSPSSRAPKALQPETATSFPAAGRPRPDFADRAHDASPGRAASRSSARYESEHDGGDARPMARSRRSRRIPRRGSGIAAIRETVGQPNLVVEEARRRYSAMPMVAMARSMLCRPRPMRPTNRRPRRTAPSRSQNPMGTGGPSPTK